MPMVGPKRGNRDREQVLTETARMYRAGYSQAEIAAEMGVGQSQVSQDLKLLRTRWQQRQHAEIKSRMYEILDGIEDVRREAWKAYELSRKACEKLIEEQLQGGKGGGYTKTIREIQQRLPGNEYLTTILATYKQERELLGLDAPKQVEAKIQAHIVNWDAAALVEQSTESNREDSVEDRLNRLMDLSNTAKELVEEAAKEIVVQEVTEEETSAEEEV